VVDALGLQKLEALFDIGYHTKHLETIFARVLG
jgi:adenylosuccinate lyase